MLWFSIHSSILRRGRHTVVIDTCCGDDRERPKLPIAHRLKSGWLGNLRRGGVAPEQVDYVLCTHLHVDHVG